MKIEFLRWGNSIAVRIPKAFAKEIGAVAGKAGDMTIANGKLVVTVPKRSRRKRRYTLEQLCEGLTPQEEIDWGTPVGNEYGADGRW